MQCLMQYTTVNPSEYVGVRRPSGRSRPYRCHRGENYTPEPRTTVVSRSQEEVHRRIVSCQTGHGLKVLSCPPSVVSIVQRIPDLDVHCVEVETVVDNQLRSVFQSDLSVHTPLI